MISTLLNIFSILLISVIQIFGVILEDFVWIPAKEMATKLYLNHWRRPVSNSNACFSTPITPTNTIGYILLISFLQLAGMLLQTLMEITAEQWTI